MTQFARPDADDSNAGNYVNQSGSSSNLFDSLNETTRDTADYVVSPTNPSNAEYISGLSSISDPQVDVNHVLRIGIGKNSAAGRQIDAVIQLRQGTTVIREDNFTNIGAISLQTLNLSSGQAALITNYADLNVRIVGNAVGGGAGRTLQCDFIEFEVPNATIAQLVTESISISDSPRIGKSIPITQSFSNGETIIRDKNFVMSQSFVGSELQLIMKNIILPSSSSLTEKILKSAGHILSQGISKTEQIIKGGSHVLSESHTITQTVTKSKFITLSDEIAHLQNIFIGKLVKINQSMASAELLLVHKFISIQDSFSHSTNFLLQKTLKVFDAIISSHVIILSKNLKLSDVLSLSFLISRNKPVTLQDTTANDNVILAGKNVKIPETTSHTFGMLLEKSAKVMDGSSFVETLQVLKSIILREKFYAAGAPPNPFAEIGIINNYMGTNANLALIGNSSKVIPNWVTKIKKVKISLKKNNSPTGTVIMEIYSGITLGVNNGTLEASSINSVDVGTQVSGVSQVFEFDFVNVPNIVSERMAIVCKYSITFADGSNFLQIDAISTDDLSADWDPVNKGAGTIHWRENGLFPDGLHWMEIETIQEKIITGKSTSLQDTLSLSEYIIRNKMLIIQDTINKSTSIIQDKILFLQDAISTSELVKIIKSFSISDTFSISQILTTIKDFLISTGINTNRILSSPVQDISNAGGWTDSEKGNNNAILFDELDETIPDDDTSAISLLKVPQITDTFEVKLATITDPAQNSGIKIKIRGKGDGDTKVRGILLEGTTVIAVTPYHTLSILYDSFEYELTETEANSITDYSDLRIRIEPDII